MQRKQGRCEIILVFIFRVMGHRDLTIPSSWPFSCATARFHFSISPKWISLDMNSHFFLPVKPQLGPLERPTK
jgi:hypothetical protein